MNRRTGLAAAMAAAGLAVVGPLHAGAYTFSFSYSISPTTAGARSTVTIDATADPSRTLVSTRVDTATGESWCHHGDATCAPPDGTSVGSMSVTAHWLILACASATETFDKIWIAPDGNYMPPDGTVVAEFKLSNTLFGVSFGEYVVERSDGSYYLVTPSWPNLTCHSSTYAALHWVQTIDSSIHRNPATVGSHSVSLTETYSSGVNDTASATYVTT